MTLIAARVGAVPDWSAALRDLFEIDRVGVVYQPLVDPHDGTVIGHEALARFRNRRGVLVPPDHVFETLHNAGPGVLFAAECALKRFQIRCAPGEGLLFLNLDPCGLAGVDPLAASSALEGLLESRDGLVIELIENTDTAHTDVVERVTQDLHARGARLALDDIGARGTLLSMLQLSVASYLKFDRRWLQPRGRSDPGLDMALLETLLSYARQKGKKTVLEGVETESHRRIAQGLGFDLVQGYLYRERFTGVEGPLSTSPGVWGGLASPVRGVGTEVPTQRPQAS